MAALRHLILTLMCVTFCALSAQDVTPRLQASLITCYPGPEIYELVGHEALRIRGIDNRGEAVDSVWNYGVFDFNAPAFAYRFAKGETDYMVWSYPFDLFLPQYVQRGSKVVEQDLNFTPEQTMRLLEMLRVNALPANRTYRYNYVRDNCSTRVAAMLDSAVAPQRIIYPDSTTFKSFRDAMRHYHRNYPWYQFGIDLALGSGIDAPVTSREEQFSPLRLMELASEARFADSDSLLVKNTVVLNEGVPDATLPPTPWYYSPLFAAVLLLAISLCISIYEYVTKRVVRWWMALYFAILGITGCVIWFLVFMSSHDSTSPNMLFLWLSPLQLIPAIFIWWRSTRPIVLAMMIVNIIVMIVLACMWPFQAQSANPAVFPLWGATLLLSAVYAILYPYDIYRAPGRDNRPSGKNSSRKYTKKQPARRYKL